MTLEEITDAVFEWAIQLRVLCAAADADRMTMTFGELRIEVTPTAAKLVGPKGTVGLPLDSERYGLVEATDAA